MADFTFAHREEGFDEHIEKSIRGYSNLLEDVLTASSTNSLIQRTLPPARR